MPTINDLKLANLITLGYSGTVDDAEFDYLGSLGHTGTLDDRRKQFWIAAGFANEMEFLRGKGYSGTLQDMQGAAFTDGAYYAYLRNNYWRALGSSERIRVPYGTAGITASGSIVVQLTFGHTSTSTQNFLIQTSVTTGVSYRYVLMGSYNMSTGYVHYVNGLSTSWSQGTSTLNTNFWVLRVELDIANYTHQAQFWSEADPEGTLRTSTLANLTHANIDAHTISNYLHLNVSSGFQNLCIKDVYVIQNNDTVVYLPIDDGSGTTLADQSGNGNDGLLFGTVNGSWVETAPYIEG